MMFVQFIGAEYRNSDICVKRQTDCVYRDTDWMEQSRTPFGKRLYDSREAAELTQEEAAKRVGMSQGTLAEAEITGKRSGFTSQLAALYGVCPIWLSTGKGNASQQPGDGSRPSKRHSKLVQSICDVAETINDIGLKKLISHAEDIARLYPIANKKPARKPKAA